MRLFLHTHARAHAQAWARRGPGRARRIAGRDTAVALFVPVAALPVRALARRPAVVHRAAAHARLERRARSVGGLGRAALRARRSHCLQAGCCDVGTRGAATGRLLCLGTLSMRSEDCDSPLDAAPLSLIFSREKLGRTICGAARGASLVDRARRARSATSLAGVSSQKLFIGGRGRESSADENHFFFFFFSAAQLSQSAQLSDHILGCPLNRWTGRPPTDRVWDSYPRNTHCALKRRPTDRTLKEPVWAPPDPPDALDVLRGPRTDIELAEKVLRETSSRAGAPRASLGDLRPFFGG